MAPAHFHFVAGLVADFVAVGARLAHFLDATLHGGDAALGRLDLLLDAVDVFELVADFRDFVVDEADLRRMTKLVYHIWRTFVLSRPALCL